MRSEIALATGNEREPFEQMDILLVLEQRAVERRNEVVRIGAADRLGRDVLGQ